VAESFYKKFRPLGQCLLRVKTNVFRQAAAKKPKIHEAMSRLVVRYAPTAATGRGAIIEAMPVYPETASPSASSLISDNLFLPSDC
jgi:hypothetical protein